MRTQSSCPNCQRFDLTAKVNRLKCPSVDPMCGRFTQRLTWRELAELYRFPAPAPTINPPVHWNGAPTQDFAACLLDDDGGRTIKTLRWGLLPPWATDIRMGARLINARAETAHESPPSATPSSASAA